MSKRKLSMEPQDTLNVARIVAGPGVSARIKVVGTQFEFHFVRQVEIQCEEGGRQGVKKMGRKIEYVTSEPPNATCSQDIEDLADKKEGDLNQA